MSIVLILLAVVFALSLGGFVLALRSTPAKGYRPARRTPVRNTSPDLFVPTDPSQRSFPRGTRVL